MSRRGRVYLAVAVALVLAGLAWAFTPAPVPVEWSRVTLGPFEMSVEDDGQTRLRDSYVVSAPLAGKLTRITLREGDQVRAGDPVAVIQPALAPLLDARARREQQARAMAAAAQVRAAAARRDAAATALRQARNEAARSAQLAQQGFVSASGLEADQLQAASAAQEFDSAAAQYQGARHELELAQAALEASVHSGRAGAPPFTIPAPIGGEVLGVAQISEAVVPVGAPLLELGNRDQLEVVADLLTSSAALCRPGSPVVIDQWGGPPLRGQVRRIQPAGFTKISALGVEEQRVNVLIDILDERGKRALGVGYRVNVRITTLRLPRALKLPASALFPLPGADPSGPQGVYVIQDGRARLTRVRVAGRNALEAWLHQGPAAGTPVIVYPSADVTNGARVRMRSVAQAH
jgi:HlyD family secretion protein